MRTLFRATVMLATLVGGTWLVMQTEAGRYLRPLATRAIEALDEQLGSPAAAPLVMDSPPLAQQNQPSLQLIARPSQNPPNPQQPAAAVEPLPLLTASSPTDEPVETLAPDIPQEVSAVDELRELGATEIVESAWGNDGQLYRCSCQIPLKGNSGLLRHVESVASDPQTAVQAVLEKAKLWSAQGGGRVAMSR